MWVYQYLPEEGCYTVGFFDPFGVWHPESDWGTAEEAARRVHYLNGGKDYDHKFGGEKC